MGEIKQTPTNFRVYYKKLKEATIQRKKEDCEEIEKSQNELNELYVKVKNKYEENKDCYVLALDTYNEFVNNKYTSGIFYAACKKILFKGDGEQIINKDYYDVYRVSELQRIIAYKEKDVAICNKILNIKLYEYSNILREFFYKVQEKIIIEGAGYKLDGLLGAIIINRVKIKKRCKTTLDFNETKKKKLQLIAEGKRPYNKKENDWCKENGIEYNGVEYRVYRNDDYVYEIKLLHSLFKNKSQYVFKVSKYNGANERGKSYDDMLRETNGDLKKICNLDLDMAAKLQLCLKSDKILYSKFIRNENQKSIIASSLNWQDRQ